MYALIEIAGKQYKVEEGVSITVPRLDGEVGTVHSFDKVLYFEEDGKKIVGRPFIEGKKLDGKIISHGRGRKVIVFKFKRRKGYQTKNTNREDYTVLQFDSVKATTKKAVAKKATTKKAAAKKATTKKADAKKATTKKAVAKKTTENR